jgi:hypothetical protein
MHSCNAIVLPKQIENVDEIRWKIWGAVMAMIINRIKQTKRIEISFKERIKILVYHLQNLSLMERQFLSGENIELPTETLDQWRNALIQQRTLVEKLLRELSEYGCDCLSQLYSWGVSDMNLLSIFLSELTFLETRINQISSALMDASIRLTTLQQRGPIIPPNLREWACYVHDLERDLDYSVKMLSVFLDAIDWIGPEMPPMKEN